MKPTGLSPLRRLAAALKGPIALSLLLPTACANVVMQRHKGPEEILHREGKNQQVAGDLTLELSKIPTAAPGPIEGRLYQPLTCQAMEHQTLERHDTLRGDPSESLIFLAVGGLLAAGGAALLATSPQRSDRPRGGDRLSTRHKFQAWGVFFALPGLGGMVSGTVGLIQGRRRGETVTLTREVALADPEPCGEKPAADLPIYVSVPALDFPRTAVSRTNKQGRFALTVLGLGKGMEYPSLRSDEALELSRHGLGFPVEEQTSVPLVLEASLLDEEGRASEASLGEGTKLDRDDELDEGNELDEEDGDANELTDASEDVDAPLSNKKKPEDAWAKAEWRYVLGSWLNEPARLARSACRPPSSLKECQVALHQLQRQPNVLPGSLYSVQKMGEALRDEFLGTYQGGFKDGRRHGYGKAVYAKGRRYEGQWRQGYFHGRGTLVSESGLRYTGQWEEGVFHGQGHLTLSDQYPGGPLDYKGEFQRGHVTGQGVGSTEHYRFEGHWRNALPSGRGVKTGPSGIRIEGRFRQGKLASPSQVIIRWPEGFVWEGRWTGDLEGGQFSFRNRQKKSPDELYVLAGRQLDENNVAFARAVFRFIAEHHPSSEAARRSVDQLASLKAQDEQRALAKILQAEQAATRAQDARQEKARQQRAQDEYYRREREQQARKRERERERDAAVNRCVAQCQGLSSEGMFSSDRSRCEGKCRAR